MKPIFAAVLLSFVLGDLRAAASPPPSRYEPDIHAFEAGDREHPVRPGAVLFLGSSTIRLWTTLTEDFPGVRSLNRGFGGAELSDLTAFVGRIVTPYRPKMIVVYAGENDVARGLTAGQIGAGFETFVKRVRADLPGVKLVYLSIKPAPRRAALWDQTREANAAIKRSTQRLRDIVYVDAFTPLLNKGQPRPELFDAEGEHLNRAGYEILKSLLKPYLN